MGKSKKEYPSAQLHEYLAESRRRGSVVRPKAAIANDTATPDKRAESMKGHLVEWDQDWQSMAQSKYVLLLTAAACGRHRNAIAGFNSHFPKF